MPDVEINTLQPTLENINERYLFHYLHYFGFIATLMTGPEIDQN